MTTILRPGQRILNLPGIGVSTSRRAVSVAAAADWWAVTGKTCEGAHAAKGAASYAASKGNLAAPGTYDLADGTAYPTWDTSTGWTLNGSTQYLVTSSNVSLSGSRSFLVVFKTPSAWNHTYPHLFAHDSTDRVDLLPRHVDLADKVQMQVLHSSWSQVQSGAALSTNAVHTLAFTIDTATPALVLYVDGTAYSTSAPATLSINAPIYFGCSMVSGFPFFNGEIHAMAYYSDALTAGEVADKSAKMAAL